jgi:hypothetical protein
MLPRPLTADYNGTHRDVIGWEETGNGHRPKS